MRSPSSHCAGPRHPEENHRARGSDVGSLPSSHHQGTLHVLHARQVHTPPIQGLLLDQGEVELDAVPRNSQSQHGAPQHVASAHARGSECGIHRPCPVSPSSRGPIAAREAGVWRDFDDDDDDDGDGDDGRRRRGSTMTTDDDGGRRRRTTTTRTTDGYDNDDEDDNDDDGPRRLRSRRRGRER